MKKVLQRAAASPWSSERIPCNTEYNWSCREYGRVIHTKAGDTVNMLATTESDWKDLTDTTRKKRGSYMAEPEGVFREHLIQLFHFMQRKDTGGRGAK